MKNSLPWWLVIIVGWLVIGVLLFLIFAWPAIGLSTGDTGPLAGSLGTILLIILIILTFLVIVQTVRVGPDYASSGKTLCRIAFLLAFIPFVIVIAPYVAILLP